jgi:hypothetical protein
MSPIGRIFIVLNLILAGLFLGWASQVVDFQQDYRQKLQDEQAAHALTTEESETATSGLRSELNAAKDDARLSREQAQSSKDRSVSLEGQLQTARNDLSVSQNTNDTHAETISGFKDTIEALDRSKSAAVDAAHSAEGERDTAQDEAQTSELSRRDAVDALSDANTMIAQLEIDLNATTREAASLDAQLVTLLDLTNTTRDMITGQPLIKGAVLGTRMDLSPGLVALNVGSNQGVMRGMSFHIFSGGTYKGEVRVEDVQADKCSALVVLPVSGTTMGQGDQATTQL